MPSLVKAMNLLIASFKTKQKAIWQFSEKFEKNYRAVQEAISVCVIETKHNWSKRQEEKERLAMRKVMLA